MGRDPTRTVLPILIGIVLLSAAWSAVSSVVASPDEGHLLTPAVAGGGTHEILPDPRRPLIYQVGVGDSLWYLNGSTGQYLDSVFFYEHTIFNACTTPAWYIDTRFNGNNITCQQYI